MTISEKDENQALCFFITRNSECSRLLQNNTIVENHITFKSSSNYYLQDYTGLNV